jgi:hypothetical protein
VKQLPSAHGHSTRCAWACAVTPLHLWHTCMAWQQMHRQLLGAPPRAAHQPQDGDGSLWYKGRQQGKGIPVAARHRRLWAPHAVYVTWHSTHTCSHQQQQQQQGQPNQVCVRAAGEGSRCRMHPRQAAAPGCPRTSTRAPCISGGRAADLGIYMQHSATVVQLHVE